MTKPALDPGSRPSSDRVRPRRLVHRGVVDASAFFVARAPSERRARERIVELAGGADIHRVPDGWIVHLRAPISVACLRAPGAPLVAMGKGKRVLSSAPLDADELEALGARDGFVLTRGGEAQVVESQGLEDPSAWLDLEGFALAEVSTLGVVPPPPARVLAPVRDPRTALGGAPPSPELAAIVAAIAARAEAKRAGTDGAKKALGKGEPGGDGGGEGGGGAFAGILAMLAAFASFFGTSSAGGGGGGGSGARPRAPASGGSSRALASLPQEPSGPSWLERARARMLDTIARLLVRTRMASFFGKKHAEYLRRMLELFEDGDIDEALRYAIPLGDGESEDDGTTSPALLPPTPRSALDISLFGARARRSLGLGDDLFDHLKKRYRAAFEKLSAQGRHKDAAFVLVELLGETAEAVSYLERHGMYQLAAEIAEARKLPPGLVVRQWMLAGDLGRAIAIARLHGAFADAVVRLEASHKDRATALRMLWADSLADAGAFAAAVEVVWPVIEARPLALRWIDRAIDVGGPVGAKMLAKKIKLAPDAFAELRDATLELLDDDAVEAPACRRAFGGELAIAPATPEVRVLARPTARVLARDGADPALLDLVIGATSDLVLRSEIAATSRVTPAIQPITNEPIVRTAGDRGAIAATDAALLPNGQILVALGEAGVRLLAPDGRTIARFLEPAHALVVSDHGDRAIALARRGKNTWRLSRIDLATRRVRTWRDARFEIFAPDFDGATWLVGEGNTLHAIDVVDDTWRALWSTSERDGTVEGVARSAKSIQLLHRRGEKQDRELLTYDVAGYVLRKRHPIAAEPRSTVFASPSPDGAVVSVQHADLATPTRKICIDDGAGWRPLYDVDTEPTTAAPLGDRWSVLTYPNDRGVVLHFHRPDSGATLKIAFEGAERAFARRRGDHLLTYDDRGRILLLATLERRVAREWRVS